MYSLKELYDAGIRINVPKPDITIKKASHGGVRLHAVGTLNLDIEEVRSILSESKMMNADVLVRGGATQDDLIDALQGNRVYVPAFIVVNKVDLVDKERYLEIEHDIAERFGSPPLMISAARGYHLEEVKDAIYDCLGFIRVYLKPHGGEADLENLSLSGAGVRWRMSARNSTVTLFTGSGMHGYGESRSNTPARE